MLLFIFCVSTLKSKWYEWAFGVCETVPLAFLFYFILIYVLFFIIINEFQ